MQEISEYFRRTGLKIGFVPTMGFLHEGHVSLIIEARDNCDIVVVSIFVNPVQFAPNEDLDRYPRDFLRDYHICNKCKVDYIFYPDAKDIYPDDYKTYININDISDRLEGKYRPGHFTGVATIVLKLFNIVKPHISYFGQKDAQQAIIVKKFTEDLNVDTEIKICETIREETGLAKSSRNSYLTEEEKEQASILYKSLLLGKNMILSEDVDDSKQVRKAMTNLIESNAPKCKLEYIAITDNKELKKIDDLKIYKGEILISLAAYFGKTRLIDNILFTK